MHADWFSQLKTRKIACMGAILRLSKTLEKEPDMPVLADFQLGKYRSRWDIESWLGLKNTCFSRLGQAERGWTEIDFQREFLQREWWSPERMWFASLREPPWTTVGSATLAAGPRFCLQWMMVAPEYRCRGIGHAMLGAVETSCWTMGGREIGLETLDEWTDAVRLYRSLGYREL